MAGIVLVLACVVIWMSEKSTNGDWGASGLPLASRLTCRDRASAS